jgi:pantothenate kinase-related protein Tda10
MEKQKDPIINGWIVFGVNPKDPLLLHSTIKATKRDCNEWLIRKGYQLELMEKLADFIKREDLPPFINP